jgi:hypothetical protein
MNRSTRAALATAALLLAPPAIAAADVRIVVPTGFLGGPIADPVPVPAQAPAPSFAPEAVTTPVAVAPVGAPAPAPAGCGTACLQVEGEARDDVAALFPGLVSLPAEPDTEREESERPPPVAPPSRAEAATAFGGLQAPPAYDWLPWQTPELRWGPVPGARGYNVQVFRGQRRVLSAWPATTSLRVPQDVLKQGRVYVWSVWPVLGPREASSFGPPVGRSVFEITLRPRFVLRTPGGRPGTAVAEVRPHIPFGTLRLERPADLRARVPETVRIDARGRFRLSVPRADAERLRAVLLDRGPTPPLGLRGGTSVT